MVKPMRSSFLDCAEKTKRKLGTEATKIRMDCPIIKLLTNV